MIIIIEHMILFLCYFLTRGAYIKNIKNVDVNTFQNITTFIII